MSSPAIVWMIVGLLTLAVTLAMLIALIRHLKVMGRAVGRFSDEVGPLAREISEQADRAAARAGRLPGGGRRP